MELGICVRDLPAAEVARVGHLAEEQGYGYVFVPDVRGGMGDPAGRLGGRDAFVSLGAMFEATTIVQGAVVSRRSRSTSRRRWPSPPPR